MSPQIILTIIGALNVLMGIGIYIGAEDIVTGGAFSPNLINAGSIKVGTYMHEAMAAIMISIGVIAFLNRDMDNKAAKKLLLSYGICYIISLASAMLHIINPEVHPPLPAIVIVVGLMAAAFYGSTISD